MTASRADNQQAAGRPTGALGGDVSMRERYKLRDRYIVPLSAVDLTWRHQCRCGSTIYSLWRGRYYCRTCARWIRADIVRQAHGS